MPPRSSGSLLATGGIASLGLGGVPQAGDQLAVVENEQRAREVAEYRQEKATEQRTAMAPANLDTMFAGLSSDMVEFPVVVKADVQGSVEAVKDALNKLSTDSCRLVVIHTAVGGIIESDITNTNAIPAEAGIHKTL